MNICRSSLKSGALIAAVAGLSNAAWASTYGNFPAQTVAYQTVDENDSQISGPPTVTSTPTGLFGVPLVSPSNSNTLTFPDNCFDALAANGSFDFQDGKLTFDIESNGPGISIGDVSFDEGGGWKVEGPAGDASDEATLLFGQVEITSVNGTAITPITVDPTFTGSVAPNDGTALTSGSPNDLTITSTGDNAVGIWSIDANFNFAAALAANDMTGNITEVTFALDDELQASTTDAESALTLAEIDKKYIDINVGTTPTTPVPEPSAIGVLACAGLLIRFPRRAVSDRGAHPAV